MRTMLLLFVLDTSVVRRSQVYCRLLLPMMLVVVAEVVVVVMCQFGEDVDADV